MDARAAWQKIQESNSPLLSFAKGMVPTPPEAYLSLAPGDPINTKVLIHDWIPSIPSCYRARDISGRKLHVSLKRADNRFAQGEILHLHRFVLVSVNDSTVSIMATPLSVVRRSLPNEWNFSTELCGGTGSMLDATTLIGHYLLASVEINSTAMAYSRPHHRTILGDASAFTLYSDLPNCSIVVLGAPCQPFTAHGPGDGESNPKGQLAALGPW